MLRGRLGKRLANFGLSRYCPCCGSWVRGFGPYPTTSDRPVRQNALCPVCGSLERHRLILTFVKEMTDLCDGRPKRLLHVAPEPHLRAWLSRVPNLHYTSLDITTSRRPRVVADLTRLAFVDGSFDVIFCSHVLEHVPDDRQAMQELRRVLKGWAILQVPLRKGPTHEDPAITSPADRLAHFGQEDHVRFYGDDYPDRLRQAGFAVKIAAFAEGLDQSRQRRLGVRTGEDIYLCS